MYTQDEAIRLAWFFKTEWEGLIEHFYHNLQKYPKGMGEYISGVREYAEGKNCPRETIVLLSEAYQGELIWQQYLSGMQYELLKLEQSRTPRVRRPNAAQTEPPGIPLRDEYAGEAERELGLSGDDARQAVRPVRPSASTIRVTGYDRPLYHETIHSMSGEGTESRRGAHVITLFYVREGDEYFLVAWGYHIPPTHRNDSTYRIERQLPRIQTNLRGSGYRFS